MLTLHNISITYTETLFENLSIQFSKGWTGISGSNGSGKTSLAKLIMNPSLNQEGSIYRPDSVSYVDQSPVIDQNQALELFSSSDNQIHKLINQMALKYHWPYILDQLSYGELRRMQITIAMASSPEVLIIDEPENHLDLEARQFLISTLKDYQGIGILIGHSRDIMNELCTSTLLLHKKNWYYWPGNLSNALEHYYREQDYLRKQRDQLSKTLNNQKRLLHNSIIHSNKASKALSKRNLDPKDHDTRLKVDVARLTGADKSSGRKVKLTKHAMVKTRSKIDEINVDGIQKSGITVIYKEMFKQRLITIQKGQYQLNENIPELKLPELDIFKGQRIKISGPNGAGKTTFMKFLLSKLTKNLSYMYCPQELVQNSKLLDRLDNETKGMVLSNYSRLGGNAEVSNEMSPGEYKKLYLSFHLIHNHSLLLFDELTNHLDIFAIESLESALKQFNGTIIYISHESSLLKSEQQINWEIKDFNLSICV